MSDRTTKSAPGPDPGSPFDRLREVSAAYRELVRQEGEAPPPDAGHAAVALLTGDRAGPAAFDLEAIWRAALADPGSPDAIGRRRHMSPRRWANGWGHLVSAREDVGRRIYVDRRAALSYCQQVDTRVLEASFDAIEWHQDRAIAVDPIGAVLHACRGGPFGVMMVAHKAVRLAGLTIEQLGDAVLRRAKAEAAGLDEYAAETLLSGVRQALEGSPRIVIVEGEIRGG